ncbi:MAG TPA: alpha/beta fold hydrolase [Burkholderiaceae bacterium]|nr:alpha/beta fold hydrolase [Burkholderiaceae bacterium]
MWPWLGNPAATAQRRDDLWRLLGPRPWREKGIDGERLDRAGSLERWRLHLNHEQAVPALLLRPGAGAAPRGVVLYCHAHGGRFEIGKDELLAGRPALQSPPYGEALVARGWAVLAIDHWGFGERQQPSESALVKRLLWQGATLWGWRLHDTLAALDWLRAQPGFETVPVVALGLSMGSTMALWAAALDDRIAACIDLCCAAEYDALLQSGGFDGHGAYFFVPGLLREFTLAEIAALIAPRAHLSLAGRADPLTPPAGLAALDAALRSAYAALGAPQRWRQIVEPGGHAETPTMRRAVLDELERLAADARQGVPALPRRGH